MHKNRSFKLGIVLSGLVALLLSFQNCARDLPNVNSGNTDLSSSGGLSTRYFVAAAVQSADLQTIGLSWTNIAGTAVTFSLPTKMTVHLQANGSVTPVAGGGITSGHCGFRFVVDSLPYGNETWGDVIAGISAPTNDNGNWTPWSATRHLVLPAGPHTVVIQQTGWSGTTAGCFSSANHYSAARLTIDAY